LHHPCLSLATHMTQATSIVFYSFNYTLGLRSTAIKYSGVTRGGGVTPPRGVVTPEGKIF